MKHINAGTTLADAVNFLVEKYDLGVLTQGGNCQDQSPYMGAVDIWRACLFSYGQKTRKQS